MSGIGVGPSESTGVNDGDEVVIREVGPRDGLQPEALVEVTDRVALVEALVAAGVRTIEAVAFV